MERIEDIRKNHKRLREQMSRMEVQEKSNRICRQLQNADWYAASEWIFGYYPLGNEVDCLAFLEQALADGKRIALPKTFSGEDCYMEFYEITSLSQVQEGRFHVMEPTTECLPELSLKYREKQFGDGSTLQTIDNRQKLSVDSPAVLVPGVVFDWTGNRYGYGKGYYDRYFAGYLHMRRIGLAYEHQMETHLERKKTDIRMDAVYTECGSEAWNRD